jgi:hypothetical protein
MLKRFLPALFLCCLTSAAQARAWDHIVIVVLENRSAEAGGGERIWGNPALALINRLADDPAHGAKFVNFGTAETPYRRGTPGINGPLPVRPSQASLLYLFSGSNQGVLPPWFEDKASPYIGEVSLASNGNRLPTRKNETPHGVGNRLIPAEWRPFPTANLGAALREAGKSFASFAENLPHPYWDEPGDPVAGMDAYRRKHNPAINWIALPGTSREIPESRRRFLLPAELNLGFLPTTDPQGKRWRGFALDAQGKPLAYAKLPTVALLIPNEQHAGRSASLADSDAWLSAHIAPYAEWAVHHNSLLIVTINEFGSGDAGEASAHGRQKGGALFYGAGVKPGVYKERIDALNVLATVLHDQGLLERYRHDFLATCPEAQAVCAREHENLRPIRDAFGEGPALEELPAGH